MFSYGIMDIIKIHTFKKNKIQGKIRKKNAKQIPTHEFGLN